MNNYEMYDKIIDRAKEMNLIDTRKHHARQHAQMDIESADLTFNLRLEDWLNADDFNFAHDYYGIRNCINREYYPSHDFGYFLPRFARGKKEVLKNDK